MLLLLLLLLLLLPAFAVVAGGGRTELIASVGILRRSPLAQAAGLRVGLAQAWSPHGANAAAVAIVVARIVSSDDRIAF